MRLGICMTMYVYALSTWKARARSAGRVALLLGSQLDEE